MYRDIKEILSKFSSREQRRIENILKSGKNITEIRIRSGKIPQVTADGEKIDISREQYSREKVHSLFLSFCQNSLPAFENQIEKGYITIGGGHRIGIAGQYTQDRHGKVKIVKVTSVNIRIAGEAKFSRRSELMGFKKGLLVLGPPHSGKTTLLKTLIEKMCRENISVCDERGELFSPDIDRDYLGGLPKSAAIEMATRSLAPDIIFCDEIGGAEETQRILSAVNSGVRFVCSAHCHSITAAFLKPNIKILTDSGIFDKIALLAGDKNRFYIKEIKDV